MLVAGRPVTVLLSLQTLQRGMASMSKEVCTGLNILKKGQDPPLRPDDQLPDWLWKLAEPEKTLNELRRMQKEELSYEQMVRYVKLDNRSNIRERNEQTSK
ncbi:54S ribosomal mitochondrial [Chlorella sorokiniana]|uniref:Large ribosomal subunit protein mL54 n=1 Tax=Chlorella sorokiniana TaxID=3076 RepID=A0A2P6U0M7_CHLSO|nr:54S ribosomal mitochondrial [Chlorella sorokiniana]|eukprot:PRW59850.1 54S ribosomal mitochondrial [Chlorella sorokiniana]